MGPAGQRWSPDRLGGTHTQGDKSYEMMLDAVLEGAGDMASARELRPILEHGTLANPNVIAKKLLLHTGIGPFPAEKQIPRGVYPEQRRRARNDNALWFTPTVKRL